MLRISRHECIVRNGNCPSGIYVLTLDDALVRFGLSDGRGFELKQFKRRPSHALDDILVCHYVEAMIAAAAITALYTCSKLRRIELTISVYAK